ncbi:flagellar protein FlaG [Shewanella sp. 202IG2-18]|uniref:flagellar protein FlaG n=1 Tax=Parashewanella hymeniacidonis TaxID=2807618 RepID=UPI00195F57BB|nr:flagellar protein FlaG [Parashewanella hymeniacidonis]MBM7072210.1 flagellar protein FlaG [Parashewanella hymeniacidonis]
MDMNTVATGSNVANDKKVNQQIDAAPLQKHEQQAVPESEQGHPRVEEAAKAANIGALEETAHELTEMMALSHKSIQFQVHEDSGKTVISVTDTQSGEVIRQLPSEEALKLAEKFAEMSGLLLKTEV